MKTRPTSIAVIAWILIAMGGISLITSTISLNNPITKELTGRSPLPIPLQYTIMYLGLIITLVSGIAMLRGQNWARLLYVAWSIIGFVIGIVTSPMKPAMIPGLALFLIVAFFLFRPKANEYFAGTAARGDGVERRC